MVGRGRVFGSRASCSTAPVPSRPGPRLPADWLEPVQGDVYTAWCRICGSGLLCHLKNLLLHAKSNKHLKRKAAHQPVPAPRAAGRRLGHGHWITYGQRSPAPKSAAAPRPPSPSPGPPSHSPPPSPADNTQPRHLDVAYGVRAQRAGLPLTVFRRQRDYRL